MLRKGEYHPDQYQKYLKSQYKHNMTVNIVDVAFFKFGLAIVSIEVILPSFMYKLGASNIIIGLIPAIIQVGYFLPQLLFAFLVEQLLRKKPFVMVFGIFERLPWLFLGFFTLLLIPGHTQILLILFVICLSIAFLSGGVISTAWGEMMAKAIPLKLRGKFSGMIQLLGSGLAVVGGIYVKFIMEGERFNYPINYAVLFFSCAIILGISYFFFTLNREPILIPVKKERNLLEYFQSLPLVLKKDRNFLLFIISHILSSSSVMGVGFFMVHSIKKFNLNDSVIGNFIIVSTAATLISALPLGLLADRKGHKINMVLSSLFYIAALILALIAWDLKIMYLVFIFMAMGICSKMISRVNIVFEFAPENKRPTYLGLISTISAPFILFFAFLGGILADLFSGEYYIPFIVSLVLNVISILILIVFVREPRKYSQAKIVSAH